LLKPLTSLAGAAAVFLTIYAIGLLHSRKNPVPFEIRLALGAVWTSLLIFALLAANAVHWSIILALCLASIVAVWALRPPRKPFDKLERIPGLIFSAYGLWYFVNALAPETTPDGVTYHLGLVREYVRLGGFPDRIAFYDMVPQGMEMLFTAA
jgi:hypothetical protein